MGSSEINSEIKIRAINRLCIQSFPKGFYQLFILMAYIDEFDTYVPIFYFLMQSKRHNAYKYVLSHLIYSTDWKLLPKSIPCDLKKVLKSIEEEFSWENVPIVCCLFH